MSVITSAESPLTWSLQRKMAKRRKPASLVGLASLGREKGLELA
jgi:hypothetical protein